MSKLSHADVICETLEEHGMEVEYVSLDNVNAPTPTKIAIEGRLHTTPDNE